MDNWGKSTLLVGFLAGILLFSLPSQGVDIIPLAFGIESEKLDDYSYVVSLCDNNYKDSDSREQLRRSAQTDEEKEIINSFLGRCQYLDWDWSEKHWKWFFEGDGWHSFLNNATEEFVQQNQLNDKIVNESIKIMPKVGGRDSLPPPMSVYYLYDIIENGSTVPYVSRFSVYGNGFFDKTYESELLAPKKMLKQGIKSFQIFCREDLKLISKKSDFSPACVKPDSISKLIERGWANS